MNFLIILTRNLELIQVVQVEDKVELIIFYGNIKMPL